MNASSRVRAVVPAAGGGARMGAPTPKQYLPVAGRALAEHTLHALLGADGIDEIVVAIAAGDAHWMALAPEVRERVRVVTGGSTRADSVLNALEGFSATPGDDDWVLVHDMARPCVRSADIARLLATLARDAVGGLLAVPVVDTLKRADVQCRVQATVERESLWRAQTPQMFRHGLLKRALLAAREAGVDVTDEAMAVERLGYRPKLVEGGAHNIKVTVPADLAMAEFFLGAQR